MKIINLTQHNASMELIKEGVLNLNSQELQELKDLLTVKFGDNLQEKSEKIAEIAEGYEYAMIGGAPFLMPLVEECLRARNITPLYAFSDRVVVETDGVKTSIFQHKGWVVNGQFE